MKLLPTLFALLSMGAAATALAADPPKPLKCLLVTGGCCHDYAKQKDILKAGLEKRLNIVVEQLHTDDKTTKARFPNFEKADWAAGYDVVIHDECSADVKEIPYVENIVNAHKNGVPSLNLHCAMHSYRTGTSMWFEYLGLQSSGHGPQLPIEISFTNTNHPITKGLANWVTGREELYNNLKIWPEAVPLAQGKQGETAVVIAWTHQYGKGRVFCTTLGHNNATVEDDRYLDLIARGLLWAVDKIEPDGKPKAGYAAAAK
jgi:type 1 glutamine amidotransferase